MAPTLVLSAASSRDVRPSALRQSLARVFAARYRLNTRDSTAPELVTYSRSVFVIITLLQSGVSV